MNNAPWTWSSVKTVRACHLLNCREIDIVRNGNELFRRRHFPTWLALLCEPVFMRTRIARCSDIDVRSQTPSECPRSSSVNFFSYLEFDSIFSLARTKEVIWRVINVQGWLKKSSELKNYGKLRCLVSRIYTMEYKLAKIIKMINM